MADYRKTIRNLRLRQSAILPVLALLGVVSSAQQPGRSKWVYPDANGRLQYTADARGQPHHGFFARRIQRRRRANSRRPCRADREGQYRRQHRADSGGDRRGLEARVRHERISRRGAARTGDVRRRGQPPDLGERRRAPRQRIWRGWDGASSHRRAAPRTFTSPARARGSRTLRARRSPTRTCPPEPVRSPSTQPRRSAWATR